MSSNNQARVFVSFADEDRKWLERLRKRLDLLERQGVLASWDNTRILPGKSVRTERQIALAATKMAVLMFSPDFIASDQIATDDLPALLEAAERGEIELLPVLVRPCLYKMVPGLQDLKPFNTRPLADMTPSEADALLDQVVQSAAERLVPRVARAAPPPPNPALTQPQPPSPVTKTRTAAILTALRVEYKAVRAHLAQLVEVKHPSGTVYERGSFATGDTEWAVGLVEIGAGNSRAGIEAERAIQLFTPSVILFVGVAGGIKDVRIGDVVVATKVYGYEAGKETASGFLPRPSVGETAYALEQRARAEARNDEWMQRLKLRPSIEPEVLVAPIAAGEKVIASMRSPVARFLCEAYSDAVAVEMEGRGFLDAARANEAVSAIIVRGISDLLSGKAKADADGTQQLAARHASAFAFQLLAKL